MDYQTICLTETDDHVVVIDLSRNFGHHKAMMTGLKHCQGEQIFLIWICGKFRQFAYTLKKLFSDSGRHIRDAVRDPADCYQ